jgi:dihydrofolate reductase
MERVAVITYIHANLRALEAVLEALEWTGVDAVYSGGDLVGYGPHPNEVCRLIEQRGIPTIHGTLESPAWQNTTVLEGDVSEAVSRLKQEHGETITLNGSATLLRSLLSAELVDELRLLLHPVVLGSGDRLFHNAGGRVALDLAESHAYDNGVVALTYRPTER